MTPKLQKIVDLVNDKGIEAVAKMMGIELEELLDVLFNSDVMQYIDFDQYQLMDNTEIENNMIIFGEPELESFVFERRDRSNTQFIARDKEWFKQTVPYDKIQEIRRSISNHRNIQRHH